MALMTFFRRYRADNRRASILAGAVLSLVLFTAVGFLAQVPAARHTRLDLTEPETGREIFSAILKDGEEAVLSWRNSLFGLEVIEVFNARKGVLVLNEITFADPRGLPSPEVKPIEVDDLYHTGGAFTAKGVNKPFQRVAYRVAQIGNPAMKVGGHSVAFKQEVGFGGVVVLTASSATWFEVLKSLLTKRG